MRIFKQLLLVSFLILPLLAFGQRKKRKSKKQDISPIEYPFGSMFYTNIGFYNNGRGTYDINRPNLVLGFKHNISNLYQNFEFAFSMEKAIQDTHETTVKHTSFEYGLGKSFLNLITIAGNLEYRYLSFESTPISSNAFLSDGNKRSFITGLDLGIIRTFGNFTIGVNLDIDVIESSADTHQFHNPTIPVGRQTSRSLGFDALSGTNVLSIFVGMNL